MVSREEDVLKKESVGRALVPPGSSSFSPKASGFGRDVRRMDSWYVFLFGIHRLTSLKEEDQRPNGLCPPVVVSFLTDHGLRTMKSVR